MKNESVTFKYRTFLLKMDLLKAFLWVIELLDFEACLLNSLFSRKVYIRPITKICNTPIEQLKENV